MLGKKNIFCYVIVLIILIDAIASGLFIPVIGKILIFSKSHTNANLNHLSSMQGVAFGTAFIIIITPIYFFAAPILGFLSDYLGRKKIFGFCLLATSIAYLMAYIGFEFHKLLILLLGCSIFSLGSSSLSIAQAAIADCTHSRKRLTFFSYIAATMLMVILFNLTIGRIFKYFGHHSALEFIFFTMIALSILNLIIFFFFVKETKEATERDALYILSKILNTVMTKFSQTGLKNSYLYIFFIQISWGLYLQNIYAIFRKIAHFHLYSPSRYLAFLCAMMLISVLVYLPIISRRMNLQKLIILSLTLFLGGLLLTRFSTNIVIFYIYSIPLVFGLATTMPLMWSLLADLSSVKNYGIVFGLAGFVRVLAWSGGDVLLPLLNKYSYVLPSTVSILLLSLILMALLFKKQGIRN